MAFKIVTLGHTVPYCIDFCRYSPTNQNHPFRIDKADFMHIVIGSALLIFYHHILSVTDNTGQANINSLIVQLHALITQYFKNYFICLSFPVLDSYCTQRGKIM